MTADDLVARLGLEPHPEGGACKEVYRSQALVGCVVTPGFEFRDSELASVGELSVSYPELASLLEFPL